MRKKVSKFLISLAQHYSIPKPDKGISRRKIIGQNMLKKHT
jgi:hypothetical protein